MAQADGDVIRACQEGDREAFALLFDRYHARVFRLAHSLTGDYAAACDVVQEVFMKLLTRIRQFRFGAAFDTWLYRIVLNAVHDQRRAARWLTSEVPASHADASQHVRVERDEIERRVREAVAALRPKLREPIALRYLAGLSYDEIAATLGISAGTVASRIARGHAALAKMLGGLR